MVNPGLGMEPDQRGRWRFQRKFTINHSIPAWIRNARNNGFHSIGPLIFNNLPDELRMRVGPATNQNQGKKFVNSFKVKLDKYLAGIEDDPGTSANFLLQRMNVEYQ